TGKTLPIESVLDFSGIRFDALVGKSPPPLRSRPVLTISPRGFKTGGKTKDGTMDIYTFPALEKTNAVADLIDCAVNRFETGNVTPDVKPLKRSKRLLLTAHSGGGAWLDRVMQAGKHNPKEVHLFDALYSQVTTVRDWMKLAIDEDVVMLAKEPRK